MLETFTIAHLAREFDVTTRTIRFYEDKGLITPERQGQRRVYSARDRIRLRLIMRGKRLGFSLEEIKGIIDLYDADATETAQLIHFIDKIRERQLILRRQQKDIADILEELVRREQECEDLLQQKTA
jgi:DNA-binding transcriptional MerR regulator